MEFKTKIEAYLYVIYCLEKISTAYPPETAQVITREIESIRTFVENHEQDPLKIARILEKLSKLPKITSTNSDALIILAQSIRNNIHQPSDQEKWENPLGRQFESQLQIEILQNPTNSMMASVKKISDKILEILDKNKKLQNALMIRLSNHAHPSAFGSFWITPIYQQIATLLAQNDPKKLTQIMHVHLRFADISKKLDAEYKTIAKKISEISDKKMRESEYYKERGKVGSTSKGRTNRMGLGFSINPSNTDLPRHNSTWTAAAKIQQVNIQSFYVRSLIDNDTPYIAGPSDMASILIGQMLGLNVLQTNNEKQCYTAAAAAYLISGGFNSLHEVLGPLAHCLPDENLVPNYRASTVEEMKTGKTTPPNFSAFYQNMIKIDPQFGSVLESGWKKLMRFFKQNLPHATSSQSSADFKIIIMNGIKKYLDREKGISFHLNPDKSRGIARAINYYHIISSTTIYFKELVIAYAILASKNGQTLQKYVAMELKFPNIIEAKNYLSSLIRNEISSLLETIHPKSDKNNENYAELQKQRLDHVLMELNENVISKIVYCADTKKSYHNAYSSDFAAPLNALEKTWQMLQSKDSLSQSLLREEAKVEPNTFCFLC